MEYFEDSQESIWYGEIKIQPLAYQDDILKGSKNISETQVGNIRLSTMLESKGLEAHRTRPAFLSVGQRVIKKV